MQAPQKNPSVKWNIKDQISEGAFGSVHLAHDPHSDNYCVVKIAKDAESAFSLAREKAILKLLTNRQISGVPKYIGSGKHGSSDAIFIQQLGPSLVNLLDFCGGTFSVPTTLKLAKQMLQRLQDLHDSGLVHQDLKPGNTTIGLMESTPTIYLIDFGLSDQYMDSTTHQHKQSKRVPSFMGTMRYAPINAHKNMRQSRRDDLESLAYLLLYMCRDDGLPWCPSLHSSRNIQNRKQHVDEMALCGETIPLQLGQLLMYAKKLRFDQRPDYQSLIEIIEEAAQGLGVNLNDGVFDWSVKATIVKKYPLFHSKILAKQFNKEEKQFTTERFFDSQGNFILDRIDKKTVDEIMNLSKSFRLKSFKDFENLLELESIQRQKFVELQCPLVDKEERNKIAQSQIFSNCKKNDDQVIIPKNYFQQEMDGNMLKYLSKSEEEQHQIIDDASHNSVKVQVHSKDIQSLSISVQSMKFGSVVVNPSVPQHDQNQVHLDVPVSAQLDQIQEEQAHLEENSGIQEAVSNRIQDQPQASSHLQAHLSQNPSPIQIIEEEKQAESDSKEPSKQVKKLLARQKLVAIAHGIGQKKVSVQNNDMVQKVTVPQNAPQKSSQVQGIPVIPPLRIPVNPNEHSVDPNIVQNQKQKSVQKSVSGNKQVAAALVVSGAGKGSNLDDGTCDLDEVPDEMSVSLVDSKVSQFKMQARDNFERMTLSSKKK